MKAIVYHSYGPPDVLKCEEIEKPSAGDNEVLIKVRAAAVMTRIAFGDILWALNTFHVTLAGLVRGITGEISKSSPE